jgi:uncharacterized protein YjbI with pentapeptide repeats
MTGGSDRGDLDALLCYTRERILSLRPASEPVPFRGRAQGSDALPFADEMDAVLQGGARAVWNITGPPGCGKTWLARCAAVRWGARFIEDPEGTPAVLWIDAMKLRDALGDERALTGGPFAFALAAEVPGIEPEALARLIATRPFIAVIDKDEHPDLEGWSLELPMGLGGLRILHLALRETLGGPSAELGAWDRDLVLQAFHERLGREGIERIESLERSPAAALASYPCFAGWLLERRGEPPASIADGSCAAAFVREAHGAHARSSYALGDWCEALLAGDDLPPGPRRSARLLHLGSGAEPRWGSVFRGLLLAEALGQGKGWRALGAAPVGAETLALLERLPLSREVKRGIRERRAEGTVEAANLVNLQWHVNRESVPQRTFGRELLKGLVLEGHPFPAGLRDLNLEDSVLGGISLWKPVAIACSFAGVSFRGAILAGVDFKKCAFLKCSFDLADLSGARFEKCMFKRADLSSAILSGASFDECELTGVTFGSTAPDGTPRVHRCKLRACDLSRLAGAGIAITRSELEGVPLAGLAPRTLDCEGSTFVHSDLMGLAAPGAKLKGARFTKCILADAVLRGADLRRARFAECEFQPGPASRAGLTGEMSRWDPMHGSKSGYYAQDLADGVYADPELTRTADLREADLRGAEVSHTDLFRVDLRGAKLDPPLRDAALRMQAFVGPATEGEE